MTTLLDEAVAMLDVKAIHDCAMESFSKCFECPHFLKFADDEPGFGECNNTDSPRDCRAVQMIHDELTNPFRLADILQRGIEAKER